MSKESNHSRAIVETPPSAIITTTEAMNDVTTGRPENEDEHDDEVDDELDDNRSNNLSVRLTSSYFSESSASSAASPSDFSPSNKNVGSIGTAEIQEGLNTIESCTPQRKDSDDFSLSKIKPVHNFFGQMQSSPYDSEGSDGSLVFSPSSLVDDHKTATAPVTSSDTNDNNNKHGSTTPFSIPNRDRFNSVDSNGSVRYLRPTPQKSPANISDTKQNQNHNSVQQSQSQQPINPHLLPYHERRKLLQQREYQQQNQHLQYHNAMAQAQAHSQRSSQTQQHQNQYQNQNQGHPPSHHPTQSYPVDPRMAAAYYQMYGIPPPGVYTPLPHPSTQQQSGNLPSVGYAFPQPPPPQPGAAYYHQQIPNAATAAAPHGMSHPQVHPPVHQFHHQIPASGFHQQQYPPPQVSGHMVHSSFPSPYLHGVPPQFAYIQPNPVPPLNNHHPDQQQQEQQSREQQQQQQPQQQQTPQHPRSGKQNIPNTNTNDTTTSRGNSDVVSATKKINPPRPPTATRNNDFHRDLGSSGSIPPPPPPPPPPQSLVLASSGGSSCHSGGSSYHSRADSYGSMSSLEGHGPISTNFSKDEDDDRPAQPSHQRPPTPKSNRPTIDTSITMTSPESQGQVIPQHERKNSFLDMLRLGWSPQSRDSPSGTTRKKPNVNEFHRKNQEFLNRATAMHPFQKSSTVPMMLHRRIPSQDRPPASRGTHRRLHSISNDEWDEDKEEEDQRGTVAPKLQEPNRAFTSTTDDTSDSGTYIDEDRVSEDDDDDDDESDNDESDNVNEYSSLLPPSGISSNEKEGKDSNYDRKYRRGHQNYESTSGTRRNLHPNESTQVPSCSNDSSSASISKMSEAVTSAARWDNRTMNMTRKSRKKKYRHKNSKHLSNNDNTSSESSENSSDSSFDHRKWTKKRARMLEKERTKLIEQWKEEAKVEAELLRKREESNRWHHRLWNMIVGQLHNSGVKAFRCLTIVENFIGNLPLTIGAVALAVVTLGVVWFKFAEEYLNDCEPVHFHSSQCTFPEFPGCFYCETSSLAYRVAVGFHYTCTVISGLLAMLLVAKVLLATRVVMDEMSSPTTSSPAGLLCMTAVCVFAGRGIVGQIIVTAAAFIHLCLAIWFIYMALAYNIMPEPSWFPNTVGIGLSAVKTWLYYPMPGHLLMAISLSLNFFFFPISLIRVVVNKKISATVAWMQMSAPAVSLYALTIMAQPSFEEEEPDVTTFQRVHRMVYLPCMHVMCALSLLGMAGSLHSLYVRWPDFKRREFSPAHVAFCFPTLSHANSIQAYRGAVKSFSDIPSRSWRMFVLDAYWITVLVGGTVITVWYCSKFMYMLPEWTSPDLSDEEEPPAPYETLLFQQRMVTAGDSLAQTFVSPAILQANETGALILSRSAADGTLRYVRTRRVRALGFEPTMNWSEMQEEEDVLLDYVGKHPPKRRHRTLSVPGIDFNYGSSEPAFGTNNTGVYGSNSPSQRRRRSLSQGQPSIFSK